MLKLTYLLIVVLLTAFAFPSQARAAIGLEVCDTITGIPWREVKAGTIRIFYPEQYEFVGRWLSTPRKQIILSQEYTRLEALFGTPLSLPVSIRVYPDASVFSCLNSQVDQLPPGVMHAHAGSHEIALIGDRILANYAAWAKNDINFIRYELGNLIVRQIAGDHVPPGLLVSIGRYLQDPAQTIGSLQLNWGDWLEPTNSWRSLWEDESSSQDLIWQIQATSTVAYLIDTYGWDSFLKFLQRLPVSQSVGPALFETYQADLATLESGWQIYYPAYFQGRWRVHLIYNYDLTPYEKLIQAEEYGEASRQLEQAIAFLGKMNDPFKLVQAQELLGLARAGQEAEYLFAQSQQAFHSGEYPVSLAFLELAERKYALAGNFAYHLDEFSAQRQLITQVIGLRSELDVLQGQATTYWHTLSMASRLVFLGQRLGKLGDVGGYDQAKALARVVEIRQSQLFFIFAMAIIAMILVLLLSLLNLARRRPPPEAEL